MLREMRFTWEQIASTLMISRTTLWRRITEMGVHSLTHTQLTDVEGMSTLVRRFPNNGVVMMWGLLRSFNIFVPRIKVHDSLIRVSGHLVEARERTSIQRRVYMFLCLTVSDGLRCLIRWRIVIHGAIDGFSRRIVYLQASDNNRAGTVVSLFRQAVNECGWPSRVRLDRGGENVDVARVMLGVCGTVLPCWQQCA